jgi:N-methylhydantoinase A/oxoprolinase/acetone carboxylase beta subunit
MIRMGVDVGGTNTDAVVMRGNAFLGGAKRPTTPDILSGVEASMRAALEQAEMQAAQLDAVMVGTTHFVNALVERRDLARTGLVRLCLPSGGALHPFADWPDDLVRAIGGRFRLIHGGYEMDGREISPLNREEMLDAVDALVAEGCERIAIASVFSPVRDDMEGAVAAILAEARPDIDVTLSRDIGRMGLLERENAAIVNAALKGLANDVVAAFSQLAEKLGLGCPLYFTRNDGTLIEAEEVMRLPVLTFACGPTNSMRGAAFLSGLTDALVVDIGGTTTDVGEVKNGFPRLAGTSVTIADVRTNFSMPDVTSMGLGGGSLMQDSTAPSIGPKSVGHRLLKEACIFGGDTLTASDLAVAVGRADMGGHSAPKIKNAKILLALMDRMLSEAVARARTSDAPLPVIAVGGGSVLMGDTIDGLKVVRPDHHDLANAVGAAIAQVSGEASKVVQLKDGLDRDAAIAQVTQAAHEIAISRGADPATITTLSISDTPLAYLPGDNLSIRVSVVGDLNTEANS